MDSITERNWAGHVLTFIVKGITDYKKKKKKAIDGCLFALVIIYFHLSKNKGKKRAERPPKPWIANWSKEQTQSKKKKVVVEDSSPEEDQYFDGKRYEISSEELDELLRENVDKSAAERENEADLRSTEGRYVSSET
ncbi:hypothetical protein Ahy_Scaffold1g106792 isoform A [Arachis hypogaea]|uniref:Uncharacterized protein n=1 Tax=Arachis hypogaea TaxID=3818 RepID=A0A444WS82_ARAHY|nr:hypothetical protein Ahy_Scaffold1g106792 isoform A [Arachis hypogaea]